MYYDTFISYRRETGEDLSHTIKGEMEKRGFSCFWDQESMRSGRFNEQIYQVIEECENVIVVLTANSLDRCVNQGDWVRNEVSYAIKLKKNIVPVIARGFDFPEVLPDDINDLRWFHGLVHGVDFFDARMDELASRLQTFNSDILYQRYQDALAAKETRTAGEQLVKGSELGFAWAQYDLGRWYEQGVAGVVEKNWRQAVRWLEKAAASGPADIQLQAELALFRLYTANKVQTERLRTARQLLAKKQLLDQEQLERVLLALGLAYLGGDGVEQDLGQGFACLKEIKHNGTGLFNLARCYINGWGTDKDWAQAAQYIQRVYSSLTAQWQHEADLLLGDLYRQGGFNLKKNEAQAAEHFKKVGNNGPVCLWLAEYYYRKADLPQALTYARQGRELNNGGCCRLLLACQTELAAKAGGKKNPLLRAAAVIQGTQVYADDPLLPHLEAFLLDGQQERPARLAISMLSAEDEGRLARLFAPAEGKDWDLADPGVQVKLLLFLAINYGSAEPDAAQRLFNLAAQRAQLLADPPLPSFAYAANVLADQYQQAGKDCCQLQARSDLCRCRVEIMAAAKEKYAAELPAARRDYGEAAEKLGHRYLTDGDYPAAITAFNQALEQIKILFALDQPAYCDRLYKLYGNIGLSQYQRQNYQAAVSAWLAAKSLYQKMADRNHSQTYCMAIMAKNAALAYYQQKKYPLAETEYLFAAEQLRQLSAQGLAAATTALPQTIAGLQALYQTTGETAKLQKLTSTPE